ncbi:MAG: hypothetical protein GF417_05605 [Candidatus Latescibacteria bacterium]|nr:hypothetical protein [bacterium]MBD3423891.1 hypothetical protein [Candidatus Latescibacterota bacterium]
MRRLRSSGEIIRDNPRLARSVLLNMGGLAALAVISSLLTAVFVEAGYGIALLLWTVAAIMLLTAIFLLNIGLIRREDRDRAGQSFGISNLMTSLRIVSPVPILISFLEGYLLASVIIYAVAAITDVLDGAIARRFSQTTVIGTMIDPVGDILSTEVVFYFLWISGNVPGWLFALLTARYLEFFAGWILLLAAERELPLSSTIAGKIVGVIQFTGIILLVADMISGRFEIEGFYRNIIFYLLAASFISVIISQTYIGLASFRGGRKDYADTEG